MQPKKTVKSGAAVSIAVLLLFVNLSVAQQAPDSSSQSAPAQPAQTQQPQTQPGGVMIDPSAGPLTPSATPTATQPSEQPQQPGSALPSASQAQTPPATQQPVPQEPLGAAAAEQVKTAGGGASRPAGNAIAPVKQHQYRSLVIKLGALAAAGIAIGTVYGLSHATSSTPPHSASAATK